MKFVDRVKNLDLPLDEAVVIGSGLLDALGLRQSNDVDLAVSSRLFEQLQGNAAYRRYGDGDDAHFEAEGVEVWPWWERNYPYSVLEETAVDIEGVHFVHPDILIQKKRERGLEKDLQDIALLEDYYSDN